MMKNKVIAFSAVFAIASLVVAGTVSAAPSEYIYFMVKASGKGIMLDTDEDPASLPQYAETKDKQETVVFYARYDRINHTLLIAYYIEGTDTWMAPATLDMYETGTSLVGVLNYTLIHIDYSQLWTNGPFRITYREKDGLVQKARLKSLGASYTREYPKVGSGEVRYYGALKMMGKMVDPEDLPDDVKTVFGM